MATGSVKGKGLEGAAGTVTAKPAMGVRPVASVALATLRQSATAAIWYVRRALVPVPAAQDPRNPTVCSAGKAGSCITSSV